MEEKSDQIQALEDRDAASQEKMRLQSDQITALQGREAILQAKM